MDFFLILALLSSSSIASQPCVERHSDPRVSSVDLYITLKKTKNFSPLWYRMLFLFISEKLGFTCYLTFLYEYTVVRWSS